MIMRMFLIAGLVLLGVTGYFTVVVSPPNFQASPVVGEVALLQKSGRLPTTLSAENEELEHDIFDVPPMDEMMLEAAKASGGMAGMDMGGMKMDGMDMSSDSSDGTMTMPGGTKMKMSDMAPATDTAKAADGTMTMPDGTKMKMSDMAPATDTAKAADGTMTMADGTKMKMSDMAPAIDTAKAADGMMTMPDGTKMKMSDMAPSTASAATEGGAMKMADGSQMQMDTLPPAPDGLRFSDSGKFDREITLAMSEWTFSDLQLDVKKGERIRFTVRNDGNILHEFMFMTMPAMSAVNYRAKRADWNLLEHEALFEQSLLLPGNEVSFVVEVQQDGNWMFMCMLPYHMQMGMMGQMATPGMAMKM